MLQRITGVRAYEYIAMLYKVNAVMQSVYKIAYF